MKTFEKVHELFLNYACSAKCPFCYNPPLTPALLRLDLTYEQAVRSLAAGKAAGARALNLHGGEVTLRDDLTKILRMAGKLGFGRITVVTNGIKLASAAYVRGLKAAGATHIRVSLHAAGPALHDGILAIPGGFDKAVAGIAHARAAGLPLGLNFVMIRRNAADLPAFLSRFCVADGIDDVIVYFPHLRGMMALNAAADGLDYSEAARHVRAGAALLDGAGRRESLLLANFPPCAVPELADRMIDWQAESGREAAMTHPEGFTEDIVAMKHGQKTQVAACRPCSLRADCLGVDREYAALYGGRGLAPLARAPGARA